MSELARILKLFAIKLEGRDIPIRFIDYKTTLRQYVHMTDSHGNLGTKHTCGYKASAGVDKEVVSGRRNAERSKGNLKVPKKGEQR